MSRRSRSVFSIYLAVLCIILLMPFAVMKIADISFFTSAHTRAASDHHLETNAEDVPYVGRLFAIYKSYSDSQQGQFLISSEGSSADVDDECQDMAYKSLAELDSAGIISHEWIEKTLPALRLGDFFIRQEYYYETDEGLYSPIHFAVIIWQKDDQSLKLLYDEEYNRILRLSYTGPEQLFQTLDRESLCRLFIASYGLDILEDWSFNGKRLISPKASLSVECSQEDGSAVLGIMPKELILMGD